MTLRITHLGSGSKGNATLLETEHVRVLVDQGFSGASLERRLKLLDLHPTDVDAILVTHHHGDHGGGALIAQRRWEIPVHANARTAEELSLIQDLWRPFISLETIQLGPDLAMLPVPVPHSGADNVAFIASHQGQRAAFITDLGSWTDELVRYVRGCEHISVEANYDDRLLAQGPYPRSLKERISGKGGHLSNDQTGAFLAEVVTEATTTITLTHLSDMNNRPHLAESTVLYYLDDRFQGDIRLSMQDGPEFSVFLGDVAASGTAVEGLVATRLQREGS
ncbi:MAG: MBL fold metallo-hydrolase [Candidatus Poseidoniaceae archaeon]